jgi:hypothetical protein
MAGLTLYGQKALLDHVLGIAPFPMPAGLYLGLFQTDPTDAGTQTSELIGGGYARIPLGGIMSATNLATGQSTNNAIIVLGPATSAWNIAGYAGILDAAVAGNMLIYGSLVTAMLVQAGDAPPISQGGLVIGLS